MKVLFINEKMKIFSIVLISVILCGCSSNDVLNNDNTTSVVNKGKTGNITTEANENNKEEKTTTSMKNTTTKTTTKAKTEKTTSKTTTEKQTSNAEISFKDGAYYVGDYLIANKTYFLDKDFVPKNTHIQITEKMDGFCKECIDNEAYTEWLNMKSDAAALGLNLWIQSGYRSYDYQKDLYDGYVNKKGQIEADRCSARPGSSEHQTGLAFDLNTITTSFKDTEEGKWVHNNAYLYGYIIRYPEGAEAKTGYKYEPWHLRYVGKDLASKLYNNGNWISMEEYFNITSKYSD